VPVIVDDAMRILLVPMWPEILLYMLAVIVPAADRVSTDSTPAVEGNIASVEEHV
jgi:hypothetical protein